jgi:hypothetical protein
MSAFHVLIRTTFFLPCSFLGDLRSIFWRTNYEDISDQKFEKELFLEKLMTTFLERHLHLWV